VAKLGVECINTHVLMEMESGNENTSCKRGMKADKERRPTFSPGVSYRISGGSGMFVFSGWILCHSFVAEVLTHLSNHPSGVKQMFVNVKLY
jgi:hypothetical protein